MLRGWVLVIIFGRIYDSTGLAVGNQFLINTSSIMIKMEVIREDTRNAL